MRHRRVISGALAALFALTALAATAVHAQEAGEAETERPAETVTLGAAISQSGRFAAISRDVIAGYELAIETINDAGGLTVGERKVMLELVLRDDASEEGKAAEAARALIETDGVDFLLGPYSSGLSEAVAAVAEPAEVPLVVSNGTGSFLFDQGRENLFAVLSTSREYLAGTVDLIGKQLLARGRDPSRARIALAFLGNAGTLEIRAGVVEEIERWGMSIVVDEVMGPDFANLPVILKQAASERADALLLSGFSAGSAAAVEALSETQVYLPMVAMTHCNPGQLRDMARADSNYLVCGTQWDRFLSYHDRWFGTANEYAFFYEEKTGRPVSYQAAQSTAAVLVLADALERAGKTDRDAVRAALRRTNLETMFGEIRFDETGRNVAKPMMFYQIQDGRFQIVAPARWAWADMVYPAPPWAER